MREAYYKSHWRHIEDDRLERYERMFAWRADLGALVDRLELSPGMRVLDFGCGPGFITVEMARRVGPNGLAVGADLNEEFLRRARERADAQGLGPQTQFLAVDGSAPMPTDSLDRILCKNVLEYVTDFKSTLASHLQLLKSGGKILIADSDWGFLIVQPWTPDEVREVFSAAGGAFSEPYIGRRLPGALAELGYTDIKVEISAFADREGRGRAVLENMAAYARRVGGMDEARMTSLLSRVDAAIANGTFMFVLPQFLVSARKP